MVGQLTDVGIHNFYFPMKTFIFSNVYPSGPQTHAIIGTFLLL